LPGLRTWPGAGRGPALARGPRAARGRAKARDVRSWQTSASRSRTTRIDPNAGGRSTERRRTRLGHEIVFVGGTGIAVPTACATESRLALRGGRSVAVLRPARDSSMRCLINPETVLYLETVSETSGKPSGVLSNRRERAKADLSGFLGSAAWPPQSRTRSGRPRWRPSSRASSARGRVPTKCALGVRRREHRARLRRTRTEGRAGRRPVGGIALPRCTPAQAAFGDERPAASSGLCWRGSCRSRSAHPRQPRRPRWGRRARVGLRVVRWGSASRCWPSSRFSARGSRAGAGGASKRASPVGQRSGARSCGLAQVNNSEDQQQQERADDRHEQGAEAPEAV
jgi:hypothetical protein